MGTDRYRPTAAGEFFRRQFGCVATHQISVPLPLSLLGLETEPHEGLVMMGAIDRRASVAASPRTDGRVELAVSRRSGREQFWASDLSPKAELPGADRVKPLLRQLRRKGVHFSGFSMALELPAGEAWWGDASAAVALTVAVALTMRQMHPFSLGALGADLPPRRDERGRLPPCTERERMQLAALCVRALEEAGQAAPTWAGTATSLLGRAWQVLSIDARFQTVDRAPLVGEALVVCIPEGAGDRRAERPSDVTEVCMSAARGLRARSLRSVELAYLKANRSRLTDREYRYAYHMVGENQRVVYAERALREEDHRQFGQYMSHSHDSARENLEWVDPEADLLVGLARRHPGCLGARKLVEGLPGVTLNLVAYHEVLGFMQSVCAAYRKETGGALRTEVCQMVDGAG